MSDVTTIKEWIHQKSDEILDDLDNTSFDDDYANVLVGKHTVLDELLMLIESIEGK